jgi:putative FmdB family regulatory protein
MKRAAGEPARLNSRGAVLRGVAMPLHEYECRSCGKQFEELVSLQDESAPACPSCGSLDTARLVSACAVRSGGGSQASASACAPGGFT